jgi:hypothetical protein
MPIIGRSALARIVNPDQVISIDYLRLMKEQYLFFKALLKYAL